MRLTEIGRKAGLVDDRRYRKYLKKIKGLEKARAKLDELIKPKQLEEMFIEAGESAPYRSLTVRGILRRANITKKLYNKYFDTFGEFTPDVIEQIFTEVKYEGYLARAEKARADQKKLENSPLPSDIDYSKISGLRLEAREKLNKIHPLSIGQASRISGVTPADINVLIMSLNLK
jgi:tRNA uridine 5-carboxymethylaminomethyl modification enzyme